MIKNGNYFRSFDLVAAALAIKQLGAKRGSSEIFGDALNSFFILHEERTVQSCELAEVLGAPDRISENDNGEIWEYDWIGKHGPNLYSSTTPFLIVDGVLKGIVREEDDGNN